MADVKATPTTATPLLPTRVSAPKKSWAGETLQGSAAEVVRDGTIFASAMNLAACAFGASMLSLPYAMEIGGPVITLLVLFGFALLSFHAGQAIVRAGLRVKKSSYSAIVEDAMGPTAGAIAESLLSIALLLAAISYIVGLSDILPEIFPFTKPIHRSVRIISVLLVLFPMTLISSLAVFGPVSAVAACGCYVQAFAVVFELFLKTDDKDVWTMPSLGELLSIETSGVIYGLPMVCFVFAYHYLLTETLDELENPTYERMTMVNLTTVGTLFGCYLPIAIAGFLNYSGKNIPTNMLKGLNANSAAVRIAQIVMSGLLFFTYSLFIIPLRRRLEEKVFGRLTERELEPDRLKVAGALCGTVMLISICMTDLAIANTLAGGCIAVVMFFFPGCMVLYGQFSNLVVSERQWDKVILGTGFVFCGVVVGVVGLFGQLIFPQFNISED